MGFYRVLVNMSSWDLRHQKKMKSIIEAKRAEDSNSKGWGSSVSVTFGSQLILNILLIF